MYIRNPISKKFHNYCLQWYANRKSSPYRGRQKAYARLMTKYGLKAVLRHSFAIGAVFDRIENHVVFKTKKAKK